MAVSTVRISGLDRVLKNLNGHVKKIQNGSKAGLRKVALIVRRRSQQLTPVDTGHLRASAYTEVYETPHGPVAEVGYMASYAPFVHEIDKDYTVGQWKFLETALKENKLEIVSIIRKNAHVDRKF